MADLNDQTQNVNIWDDAKSKAVTVTTDGSKERLDVNAAIQGGTFQLQPYTPVFDYSIAGTALNTSTDTSLKSVTDIGKLSFVAIVGTNSNYEVVIKIDGSEILRIPMSALGSSLGLANATNVTLWVETANKNFRFSPKTDVDFTSSFEILAKATAAPVPSVNWLVAYRID